MAETKRKREPRFRGWTFTMYAECVNPNDPEEDWVYRDIIEDKDWQEWWIDKLKEIWIETKLYIEFCVMGKEVCPTTRKRHIQGAVMFINPIGLAGLKKVHPTAHWEVMKGSTLDSVDYCTKEDKNAYIYGRASAKKQGQRTDLIEYRKRIENGERVDDIVMENPNVFHTYGRTLERIETIVNRQKFRTEMTKGIWLWGPSATGKSHRAFEGFHPDTHYKVPLTDKGGWWDGYKGQHTVILNDFRGELTYNRLLQLVDEWPEDVPQRNKGEYPFTSKVVIVTSSKPPQKVFVNRDKEDGLDQLVRRFEIIHLTTIQCKAWKERKESLIKDQCEYLIEPVDNEVVPDLGHRSWGTEVVIGGNTSTNKICGPPMTGTISPPIFCNIDLVNKIEEDAKMLREDDLEFLIKKLTILRFGTTSNQI